VLKHIALSANIGNTINRFENPYWWVADQFNFLHGMAKRIKQGTATKGAMTKHI